MQTLTTSRGGLGVAGSLSVALVPAVILLHLLAPSNLAWWTRLIASVPGVLMLGAWGRYLRKPQWTRFPLLEYALLQVYVSWSLPTVLKPTAGWSATEVGMESGVVAVAASALLLVALFPLGASIGRALRPKIERVVPGVPRSAPAALGALLILVFLKTSDIGTSTSVEYQRILGVVGSYYPLLALLAHYRAHWPHWRWKVLFVVAVALISALAMRTGMTEGVIGPMVAAGFIVIFMTRRVPWLASASVFALVIILQPAKLVYRSLAWGEERSPAAAVTVDRWGQALEAAWGAQSDWRENLRATSDRMNELSIIADTFDRVPSQVPYNYGRQWAYIGVLLVPRLAWADKPDFTVDINNRFNLAMGYQTADSVQTTTFAVPLVADGYWNLGWAGILLAVTMVSVLLGVLAEAFPLGNWLGLALGLAAVVESHVNGPVVPQFGAALQQTLGIMATGWAVWLVSETVARASGSRGPRSGRV